MIAAICIGVGALLIFLEFFVPGGIFAVLGILAMASAVGILLAEEASGTLILIALLSSLILSAASCWLALFVIRRSGKSGSIFLASDQSGYRVSRYDEKLKGLSGLAHTDLRPGGFVMVEGKKYAAYSSRGFVPRGSKIIVLEIEGETLKVKEVE